VGVCLCVCRVCDVWCVCGCVSVCRVCDVWCVCGHNFIGKQIYFVDNNNHMFRLASLSYCQAELLTSLIRLQWLSLMTASVYKSKHVAMCCKQKNLFTSKVVSTDRTVIQTAN